MRMRNAIPVLTCFAMVFSGSTDRKAWAATQGNAQGPTVQMTISVEVKHGKEIPAVKREDVIVEEGHDHDKVTSWLPATGPNAGLDLWILIDDSAFWGVDTQLSEVQAFIEQLPPTTSVAVGYIGNGTVQTAQALTQDHAAAAKSVRLTLGRGGEEASPYFSLQELLKHWQPNADHPRREVIMFTNGVDLYSPGSVDPYLDNTIGQLQRAGVLVYSIFVPDAGHFGHSFWRINWGKNDLSELSDEVGAESYNLGVSSVTFFKPYLDDISARLKNQYLLKFVPKPEKKAGLQRVHITTELPDTQLVGADKVWVPATEQ